MFDHSEAWRLVSQMARARKPTPEEAALMMPGEIASSTAEALIAICQVLVDLRNYKADA